MMFTWSPLNRPSWMPPPHAIGSALCGYSRIFTSTFPGFKSAPVALAEVLSPLHPDAHMYPRETRGMDPSPSTLVTPRST